MSKKCNLCDFVEDKDDGVELSDHLIEGVEEIDKDIEDLEVERQKIQDQLLEEVGEKAIGDLINYKE